MESRDDCPVVLNDLFLWLCALFLLGAALMPPEGSGVELCLFKRVTGTPCPGCGMTRSAANLVRGRMGRALQFHPLGIVVVPIIAGLGILGVVPRKWRDRVKAALLRRRALLGWLAWLGAGAFFLFGVARWAGVATGLAHFPAGWP